MKIMRRTKKIMMMKWRSWRRWWRRRRGRGGRRNKSVMIWDARNRCWKTRLKWWYIWWRRRRQGQWGRRRRRRRNYPLFDLISPSSSSDHVDKRSSNLRVSRWSRGEEEEEEEEEEEASRWSRHATKTSRVKVVIYIISSQIVEEVTLQLVLRSAWSSFRGPVSRETVIRNEANGCY